MSHPPEDDRNLISFLRHHRPNPPPAHPDLEDQILEALSARKRRRRWIIPSTLAASLVSAIVTYQVMQPQSSEAPDLAGLETYMESNWSTTINGVSDTSSKAPSTDYLAFVESTD